MKEKIEKDLGNKIKQNKELLRKQTAQAEEKAKSAINDYKKFAIKGNVVDLAIGVVIGSAFTNIVNTLVSNLVTPLLSVITSKVDIGSLFISLNGGHYATLEDAKAAGAIVLNYGSLINAILNFFIITVVLFIVFKYISKLRESSEKGIEDEVNETTKSCPYCKKHVDINATKCAYCTSDLEIIDDEPKKSKNKKN